MDVDVELLVGQRTNTAAVIQHKIFIQDTRFIIRIDLLPTSSALRGDIDLRSDTEARP